MRPASKLKPQGRDSTGGRAGSRPTGDAGELHDLFRAPAIGRISDKVPDSLRLAISLTCRRPELGPLSAAVVFSVDSALDVPFRVAEGQRVVLHPASLVNREVTALLLRHALELALWQRLGGAGGVRAQRLAVALLVGRAGALYGHLMTTREQSNWRWALPAWLLAAYDALAADDALAARRISSPELRAALRNLLRLDGDGGAEDSSAPIDAATIKLITRLHELAGPSEHLLIRGGGSRLALDPETGLNMYGCAVSPRPECFAFASSTASTISAPAYRAVEELRQALIRAGLAGRLPDALRQEIDSAKRSILAAGGAAEPAGTEVILTPSGTDGEYAALHLARRRLGERLVNIVIAPDETGSGVLHAARGLHFATGTPHPAMAVKGEPLTGLRPESIEVRTVEIRDPDGSARALEAIDAEVEALVERALAEGGHCLVHRLDASKSGLGAPSEALVERLRRRHGSRVEMVVDACQMRASAARLRGYLERGCMVLITGSKFTMGPPFAGALLVPARLAAEVADLEPLPPGLGAYFARPEWPEAWAPLTSALTEQPNLGLLFRWRAALWEIQALAALGEEQRREIMAGLGAAIRSALDSSAYLARIEVEHEDGDWPATIFPCRVLRPAADGTLAPLDVEAARQVWRWLRSDLADRLPPGAPASARRLAGMACYVGQPIAIGSADGRAIGALRICIGAHLISQVAFDPDLGATRAARLKRQIGRARLIVEKIELIVRHFAHLRAATAAAAED